MKVVTFEKYGLPSELQFKEIEIPEPKAGEVRLKLSAVGINASDWEMLTGRPIYARIWGWFKPKYKVLGSDLAGTVDAIGKDVNRLQIGDKVFGDAFEYWGGLAEYVCVPEKLLIHKPPNLNFPTVAALPQAAVIARQAVHQYGKIKAGQKVLINGAGGGVGTFALQMAKSLGAEVSAVDRQDKLEMLKSLGADVVLDYQKTDFTQTGDQYDVIIDPVAYRSVFAYPRALKGNGVYILIGGSVSTLIQVLIIGSIISLMGRKKLRILAHQPNKDLGKIAELVNTGQLRPVIDQTFSLNDTIAALNYFGGGNVKGKIVIRNTEN